jgi:hypothetical protein
MSEMSKYKRWSEYSTRWRKARIREGLNATRWNRWRRLSLKTQAKTNIHDYAKGISVNAQTRNQVLGQLTVKMHNIATTHTASKFKPASMSTIRQRLDTESTNWLRRYNNMKNLYHAVVTKNLEIIAEHGMSPLFYHGGAND